MNANKHELTILDPAAGTVGAKLKWLSADDSYAVVGYTFSKVIVDEAQAIADEVFFKLRPTLDVRDAKMRVFGTPDITQAQSWFQGMWLRGQDPEDTTYHSFSVASWETPWQKPETILDAKASMPEVEFRRLYGGEWVDDVGRIFTQVENAILETIPKFDPRKKYVMSVDLAIYEDFNVVLVAEQATKILVYKERWNQTDPSLTYDRVYRIWEDFEQPRVYADSTSPAGMAMTVGLRDRGVRVQPVILSSQNKLQMVHKLASDIQHARVRFPRWEDLLQEFRAFVYGRSPTGKITAGAAAGYHDDIIMSMVLLNEGLNRRSSGVGTFGRNYLNQDTFMGRARRAAGLLVNG
jgi:hypothetical protein